MDLHEIFVAAVQVLFQIETLNKMISGEQLDVDLLEIKIVIHVVDQIETFFAYVGAQNVVD